MRSRAVLRTLAVACAVALLASGCGSTQDAVVTVTVHTTAAAQARTGATTRPVPMARSAAAPANSTRTRSAAPVVTGPSSTATLRPTERQGTFTFAFAGDVHFTGRTLTRLQNNPATAFGASAGALSGADLTMVNLETAITDAGDQQRKSFTFKAPPVALTALRDAGIDLATEANNHGADYGASGLKDTLAAVAAHQFPVIGIGANAAQAYAPFTRTVNGVRIAVLAASQVRDETLQNWTAGTDSPGIASADSPRLVQAVKAAKAAGYLVIVYLHWGTEYTTCPNTDQQALADTLAGAGATAVVGTHAHMLQGAGWRKDGVYVAYGLSNYLWWRSFGNEQDDAGVLTLTFTGGKVTASSFDPAHLDSTGVSVPATGGTRQRINAEWQRDRVCAGLSATPSG